jgi:ubiquinol-cytochrome c reductase cytochrome c1 subunit
MRIKLKLIVGFSVLLFSVNIFAASKVHLDHANTDIFDEASFAKWGQNYS